ncbi:putative Phage related DNA methyltransferase [Magnetospirillum sp. XM-1]|uniref:site-specific DNA-methyltransferase n=1 Tax=Magnetospirillum sp. XM-1 TaxID=1663591 RepID=UPI00073E044D|nr:DNA methyltransferase [Magnetospirillum sp. XM-1]CUW39685.1 putative Phage related DNA methyltransferase [Magnetospirillum sp. XM-1]
MAEVKSADRVEQWPVARLMPYARNARTHSESQVSEIAASIGRFGFNNPVLVDEQGMIIAGHGRVLAAKRLGLEVVPVVPLPHLTEAEKRAYILADNKLAEKAGWDEDLLRLELADLQDLDIDLGVIGFEDKEIDRLLAEDDPDDDADDDDGEDAPEVEAEPVSLLGDLWVLGRHRLLCGDSTLQASVEAVMDGDLADMVWTDPPYGMSYGGGRKGNDGTVRDFGMIMNDDKTGDDLIALVRDSVGSAVAVAHPKAAVYVCFPWRTYAEFEAALAEIGLDVSACIVWDKKSIGLGNAHYRPQHEFIFYCNRGNWFGDKAQSDVWSFSRGATAEYVHPTQKPLKLIERALRNSSKKGGVVVDVFGGSGSTLIACEKRGRSARLVELDPKYVDVIVRRWESFTGQRAVLESTGQTFAEVAAHRRAAA